MVYLEQDQRGFALVDEAMSVLLQAISSRFCDSSKKIMLWLAEGLVQPGGKE